MVMLASSEVEGYPMSILTIQGVAVSMATPGIAPVLKKRVKTGGSQFLIDSLHPIFFLYVFQGKKDPHGFGIRNVVKNIFIGVHEIISDEYCLALEG